VPPHSLLRSVIRLTQYRDESAENGGSAGTAFAALPAMPDQGVCDMTKTALSALFMAWITTMIATSFFVVVLMLSRIWDSGIYLTGLQRVLSSNL
jgi:hypothetical protein